MARDVFIPGGKRTPMGEYVGALKDISAIELGAIAARAALETTGVAPSEVDHTISGNASPLPATRFTARDTSP